jgi:hypothetical protein
VSAIQRGAVTAAIVVGIVFIMLAIVYWVEVAGSLPWWLPGYRPGRLHPRYGYGAASFLIGEALLLFVWLRPARRRH